MKAPLLLMYQLWHQNQQKARKIKFIFMTSWAERCYTGIVEQRGMDGEAGRLNQN
jgi:hypothetical protein